MSYKKGIEVPSINEVAIIATMLDEAGYYADAALMDEFIKTASQHSDDLEKCAGLWSGIWKRLGGWAKKVFFKEYKELHKIAKEANEKISDRMKEARSLWKEAGKDFKTYELVSWREKILRLPVYTKDLMVDYEEAFGRLVAFTYKLQDKETKKEELGGEIGKMTAPGEGGEGKPWGTPEEKPEDGKPEKLEDPWYHSTGVASIMENGETGDIAIDQTRFERSRRWGQIVYVDRDKGLMKYNPKSKGKAAKGLKETLGDDVWQLQKEPASGWVFLTKKEDVGEIEDTPTEESVTEETSGDPGEPSLPIGIKTPGDLLTEKLLGDEPEKETPDLSEKMEEVVEPEKEMEEVPEPEDVGVIEPEEKIEVPKGKWVVYLTGKNQGRAGLVRRVDKRFHFPIADESEIERLNKKYNQISKMTQGPVSPLPYEGPEVPKKVMSASDAAISDLIDSIVSKEDMSREARMNRILLLNKQ